MSPWSAPPPVPPELAAAFREYERALMADDLAALERLFAPGPTTLRGDGDGLLVGSEAIADFRRSRGGARPRTLVQTHVQVIDADHALVVAVTENRDGGRGQQTQLWARTVDVTGRRAWVITAAHVSTPPQALDTRVWRVVGDPLVPGSGAGPLLGEKLAVKDLYAVAGHRRGAGNPAWLAEAAVEQETSPVVQALLDAGADLTGITRTDELAYSLAGTNAHYGTPPNPRAPYRVPGGSSNGSASAVSLGQASIGLGTDTAGSIRVPAAYQGLFGLRTTHDCVDRTGLLPLAERFDTVGWMTRTADLLRAVGDVLLDSDPGPGGTDQLVVVPALLRLADDDVAAAVRTWAYERGARTEDHDVSSWSQWPASYGDLQAHQAWAAHGDWLRGRLDVLGADVRARFAHGAGVTEDDRVRAETILAGAAEVVRGLVGDRVLVIPSASSVAPPIGPDLAASTQRVRRATFRLVCPAGIAGMPALSVPLRTSDGLPCGACLVAAPGRDRDLLSLAERLTAR
ncbi:hypothetical protein GCM10011519_30510 [Marmoricola endophyticus]|uniref:Amidase domain-containing protein n=1 Tax=Marmoricola endophyticus TaxID=2040280 RepID=A0A917BRT5_9ACTN|nr:AtzH-like domain-containing protein [Marmoricola endophyticus]GGF54513.1 hypothetical protein GCM10011519_30510 [Marmoricola endophyticus]